MMKNKIFACLSVLAVLALFSGCASTDDSVKEVVFDAEDSTLAEALEPSQEQDIDEAGATVVTADESAAYQVTAPAGAVREVKKNYTGWVSSSIRPVSNTKGNVKLYANSKKGTFAFSVLNENQKAISLISTANEYTTTSFYLRAGKKIIKLCEDAGVVSAAKKTENGVKIRYSIDKVAVVMIDLECISTKEDAPEDTIKVTATVLSQSKKKTDFSLKLILDTVLGETDRHHFYTSANLPVKNEVLYHTMEDEKYFVSKNAKATMQVILAGADVSPIESVTLANFSTLDTRKWESDMTTFRSFDTVLSYNNSAMGIYWPKMTLDLDQSGDYIFYISMAADGEVPSGADYIFAPVEEEQEAAEEGAAAQKTETAKEEKVQNIQAVKEEPVKQPVKETPKEEPVKETPPAAQPQDEPQNVSAVKEFDKEKLSYDYIQRLLDRIEQLEEGDPEVNKVEINMLNEELDEILRILDSQ